MKRAAAGLLTAGLLSTGLVLITPPAHAAPVSAVASTFSKATLGKPCPKRKHGKTVPGSPVKLKCAKVLGKWVWIPAISL